MSAAIDWIAADWGTTNLRLWAMSGRQVLARRALDRGMAGLAPDDFPRVLAEASAGWPAVPVIACGMVGARQGWVEAPYVATPCAATPSLVAVPGDPGGRPVRLVCGVSQDRPADVMRGEETQIAGLLALDPGFDGIACLPGTHTKWARISAGEICGFKSLMTGEIFGLLSRQSVLRHSVDSEDSDDAAFLEAVSEAMTRPAHAFGTLFQLRAESLLQGLPAVTARARLSGTLIGWELAAARPWWLGSAVTLIGAPALSALYARALAAQGVGPATLPVETATLAGLTRAHEQFLNTQGRQA
ncbi:2-dehydro-3-deoxygalactonokinase [Paracoccus sp. (in: a-proteobacteria)]|uniref:2-dehydro-3-deoxygalactonokinase n=1 Tax=Paracoccus sp. TaxID=267 RepID=UPI00321FF2D2